MIFCINILTILRWSLNYEMCWASLCLRHFCVFLVHFVPCSSNSKELSNILSQVSIIFYFGFFILSYRVSYKITIVCLTVCLTVSHNCLSHCLSQKSLAQSFLAFLVIIKITINLVIEISPPVPYLGKFWFLKMQLVNQVTRFLKK